MTTNLNSYTFTNQELVDFSFNETDLSLIYKRFTTEGDKRYFINENNILFVDLESNDEYFLIMDLNASFNKKLWDITTGIRFNNVNNLNSTESIRIDVTSETAPGITISLPNIFLHSAYEFIQYPVEPAPRTINSYYIKIIKWKPLNLSYIGESAQIEFNSLGVVELNDAANRYQNQVLLVKNDRTPNSTSSVVVDGRVSSQAVRGSFFTGTAPVVYLSTLTDHPLIFSIHTNDLESINDILKLEKNDAIVTGLNFKVKTKGLSPTTNALIKNANTNGDGTVTVLSDSNSNDTLRNAGFCEGILRTRRQFNQVQLSAVSNSDLVISTNTATSAQANLSDRRVATFNQTGCTMHKLLSYPNRPRLWLGRLTGFSTNNSETLITWNNTIENNNTSIFTLNPSGDIDINQSGAYIVNFNYIFQETYNGNISVFMREVDMVTTNLLTNSRFTGNNQGINFSTYLFCNNPEKVTFAIQHSNGSNLTSDTVSTRVQIIQL